MCDWKCYSETPLHNYHKLAKCICNNNKVKHFLSEGGFHKEGGGHKEKLKEDKCGRSIINSFMKTQQ
jgi:hypothetical protein